MRLGVPARLGIVASIILLPTSVLFDLPAMKAAVGAASVQAQSNCLQRAMRNGYDPASGPMFPESQPCDGEEDAARRGASRNALLASAGKAVGRIAVMWLLGFLAIRLWRWIMAGRTTAPAK